MTGRFGVGGAGYSAIVGSAMVAFPIAVADRVSFLGLPHLNKEEAS